MPCSGWGNHEAEGALHTGGRAVHIEPQLLGGGNGRVEVEVAVTRLLASELSRPQFRAEAGPRFGEFLEELLRVLGHLDRGSELSESRRVLVPERIGQGGVP